MSVIMRMAFEQWQEMRDAFELRRHAQYERAVADLRGELLNRRGRENHIDAYSLFLGPMSRARAYASEELLEWWEGRNNRRMTVSEFEAQWLIEQNRDDVEEWT